MKIHAKGRPGSPRNRQDQRGPKQGPQRGGRPGDRQQSRDGRPQRGPGGPDRGRGRGPAQGTDTRGRGPRPPRQQSALTPGIRIKADLLYGRNAVRESLRSGRRQATRLFIAEGVREDERVEEIVRLAQDQEILVERVPRPLLDDLTKGGNHQGIALDSDEYPYVDLEDIIERDGTVLVMDHLNDPQNFGTLMRAADAAGIAGVVIPQDRSVSVTPAVVNASAGAVEHLMVAQTPNLARAIDKLEESGRWIVGLDEDEQARNIFETDVPTPVALVLGAEGSGLSPIVRKRCQVILSLPMRGQVDSLNAATAGSIVLYDLLRRSLTEGDEHIEPIEGIH